MAADSVEQTVPPEEEHVTKWYAQGGGYLHWNHDSDFEGPPIGAGLEASLPSNYFGGILLFNNSFGEFSQYYYVGKLWRPFESYPHTHIKLSGGLVYGYSNKNIDEFPVHFGGFAPALVPSIGYKKGRVGYDVAVLGQGGLMFLIGVDLN